MNYEQEINEIDNYCNLIPPTTYESKAILLEWKSAKLLTLAKKIQEDLVRNDGYLDELLEESAHCYNFFHEEGLNVFDEEDLPGQIPLSHLLSDYKNKFQAWIACSDRLPEKNIKVLAQNEAEELSLEETDDVINISKGKINWLESYKFGNGLKIIAWMPLPQPYKENVDQ